MFSRRPVHPACWLQGVPGDDENTPIYVFHPLRRICKGVRYDARSDISIFTHFVPDMEA